MTLFDDAIRLLSEPPGNLIYYLAVMFAIEAILAMAAGEWLRGRQTPQARRWLLSSLGLLLGWGALMVVALLSWQGIIAPASIAPPTERFLNAVAIVLIAWAALSLPDPYVGAATGLVILLLILGLVGYTVTTAIWHDLVTQDPRLSLNGHLLETVWEVCSLAALGITGLISLLQRPKSRQWTLFFVICLLMAAGHLAHFVAATKDSNISGWVRLVNLGAYPLLAGLVFRQTFDWRAEASVTLQPIPEPIQIDEREVFTATAGIEASFDLDKVFQAAVSVGADVLKADFCALGLPIDPAHRQIELAALHSRFESDQALAQPGKAFYLDAQPLIKRAIRTRRQIAVSETENGAVPLLQMLDAPDTGPVLVQPLVDDRTVIGLLIAGNPQSKANWDDQTRELGLALGQRITTALVNARRWQQMDEQVERLTQTLQKKEEQSSQQRDRYETALEQSREEARTFAQQLYELERQMTEQKRRAEELAALLEQESDVSAAEIADQGRRIEQLKVQNEQLQAARQALETQIREWQARVEQLTDRQQVLRDALFQAQQQLMEFASVQGAARRDSSAQGLIVSDERGQVTAIQGAVETLLNRPRIDIVGQPIVELFDDPRWQQTLNRLMNDPEVRQGLPSEPSVVNVQMDDRVLYVEVMPIHAPEDHGFNAVAAVIYSDEALSELVHRGELIASLVQELRTPMTSITGYTDLLLGESAGILGEMQRKFLQRVKANIERMIARLEDLLEITAIDSGRLEIELRTVDLAELIEDAILNSAGQFRERDITVETTLAPSLPPLQADPDAISQVIQNLLSNAYQVSQPETTVLVSAQLQESGRAVTATRSYVMVSVADTGGGIAPEDIPRVFTRLYRADNPLIEGLGETGVGLSVAKTLVEAHGGRMWVDSELGVGTTFSFILPVMGASPASERGP